MDTPDRRPPRAPARAPADRLPWLDTLRIALTVLVVVHHAAQPYGPADWWYVEDQPRTPALATLSAVDGTFSMALFFFVSGFLVPGSHQRLGTRRFLTARLRRLGVPVLFGALTIVPGLMFAYYVHYRGYGPISFPRYVTDVYLGTGERPAGWSGPSWPDLQFGHLWFVQNLLLYCTVYVCCRRAATALRRRLRRHRPAGPPLPARVPGHRDLAVLTAALATATYLVRLRWPLDTWVPFLDFVQLEPARLPSHATFFTLGLLAHRHHWLATFAPRTGWTWLTGGLCGVALLFAVGADAPCFGAGGPGGPAALWAAYDSALCVALSVGLLTLFRHTARRPGRLSRELSATSYTVYVVHVPLVVALQYLLADHGTGAAVSWLAVTCVAVPCAYLLGAGLRRLPGARAVV